MTILHQHIQKVKKPLISYFPERLPTIILAGLPAFRVEGLAASGVTFA
jgi:hypothetical protein